MENREPEDNSSTRQDFEKFRSRYPELFELYRFVPSDDNKGRNAICNTCNKTFKKYKPSRIIEHSRRDCLESDQELVQRLLDRCDEYAAQQAEKLEDTPTERTKAKIEKIQTDLDDLIVYFISVHSLPISILISNEFKDIVSKISMNYKLPSRRKFTCNFLPAKAASYFKNAMSKLQECDNYTLTLEFDEWTSKAGMSLLAVTITTLSGHSLLLDLIDITNEHHSALLIAEKAIIAMKKSGIPERKFNAIVSDEASNCRLAREIIIDEVESGHLIEFRCMAHFFNLIGGSISKLPLLRGSLDKLMTLVGAITSRKLLVSKLRELGAKRMVHATPTRWYTTCASINAALRVKEILDLVPKTDEYGFSK